VIATAPQRRLAIKTFVRQESARLIREACLRELQARRPDLLPAQRGRDHR
jgi:transcription-repair coupling factor (superfamily II helicase)